MPEHLKTEKQIIAWILGLMDDRTNWFTENSYSDVLYYGPLTKWKDDTVAPGSLFVFQSEEGIAAQTSYSFGLHSEVALNVKGLNEWSLDAIRVSRKFKRIVRDILWDCEREKKEEREAGRSRALTILSQFQNDTEPEPSNIKA